MATTSNSSTAERLRLAFDAPAALTVGLEEELMVLDPDSLDLALAGQLLARTEGDARFKPELPTAQIELLTPPLPDTGAVAEALASARADLAKVAEGLAALAGAGAHPFAAPVGALNEDERYRFTREEYGPVAARQLVFGLHVHVRVSGAQRAIAVYNALRSYLPEIAALGANAAIYGGEDTGLASVRPKISEALPRQGVPPAFPGPEEYAGALDWLTRSGSVPDQRMWWWEARLHPGFGTVEVRVADQQTTARESAAVAAVVHSLVALLAARHDAGEALPVHPTWRIAENRWSACRHGVEGTMADLDTAESRPTRRRLEDLLTELEQPGEQLGSAAELADARELARCNGALRQRSISTSADARAVTRSLVERFHA